MKKRPYLETACLVIILTGVLVVSINAIAQTPTQMTALERKLYQAALKEGELEWWDSYSMKNATALIKAFNNKYPSIKVDYFEVTSDVREEKYLAEYSAGRKTLDVTGIDLFDRFKEKNLLLDLSAIVKDTNFPVKFCTKDFLAASTEHSLNGVAYNTKLVSPKDMPRSWEDLLDPKWKGRRISVENRLKTFIYIYPIWGQERTVKYLEKLREQNPIFTKGATQTTSLLITGEFAIAIGVHLNKILEMRELGAPVDWVPINPTLDKLTPSVIMREAPHPNAAQLFLRWFMTPEGQLFIDKIQYKGNPLPGANTKQSKALEKMGLDVFTVATWEVEAIKGLEELYGEAIGFKKPKKP